MSEVNERITKTNDFFKEVKSRIVEGINFVDGGILPKCVFPNNYTILGKLYYEGGNPTNFNVKIQIMEVATKDIYEGVKVSIINKEGVVDSFFIYFSEICNDNSNISSGCHSTPYWMGCAFNKDHFMKLAIKICEYLSLYRGM